MTNAEKGLSQVKPAAKNVVDFSACKKFLWKLVFYDRKRKAKRNNSIDGRKQEASGGAGKNTK
jgi:hypothetical protein